MGRVVRPPTTGKESQYPLNRRLCGPQGYRDPNPGPSSPQTSRPTEDATVGPSPSGNVRACDQDDVTRLYASIKQTNRTFIFYFIFMYIPCFFVYCLVYYMYKQTRAHTHIYIYILKY